MALSDRNKLLARSKIRYRIKIGKSKKLVAENKFLTREVLTTLRCEIGAACLKTLLKYLPATYNLVQSYVIGTLLYRVK